MMPKTLLFVILLTAAVFVAVKSAPPDVPAGPPLEPTSLSCSEDESCMHGAPEPIG